MRVEYLQTYASLTSTDVQWLLAISHAKLRMPMCLLLSEPPRLSLCTPPSLVSASPILL